MKRIQYGRKIIALVLAAVLLCTFSGMGIPEESSENPLFDSGDMVRIDMDSYQEYLDSLTEEDLQKIAEKEAMLEAMEDQPTTRAATKVSLPGTFTMYRQETSTYCAPACVKSALMYIKGSSPSQASIDSYIQQDFTKIPKYMNDRQSRNYYVLYASPFVSDMFKCFKHDISEKRVPTFFRLYNPSGENWYYGTFGHCLLVNAYYSDFSQAQLADPLGGTVPEWKVFYVKSSTVLGQVCSRLVY